MEVSLKTYININYVVYRMPTRKRTKVGFETEFFTIDEHGTLVNKVDELTELVKKNKNLYKQIREEIFESMMEIGAAPAESLKVVGLRYLENLKKLIEVGEENGIKLLPLSCYPAKSQPKIRRKPWYDAQSKLLGQKKFSDAIRICAFHFHYSLPRGVVETKTRRLKPLAYSKSKDTLLNQYNFLIAADPACITFCQSSPFWEGEHFVKDSRTMLYRDMYLHTKNKEIHGLYFDYPLFGGMPKYEFTIEDLRVISAKRKSRYFELLHSKGIPLEKELVHSPELRFMWGSIRVNKIGTFEYRGTDMNHPKYIFSMSYLLKLTLDAIRRNELQMLPSDIGLKEPFKREGDVVYLPPFSTLKSLEYLATVYGFENSSVHEYCSAFFNFVLKNCKRPDMKRLEPIKEMIQNKKSVSDQVLDLVRKNGYAPENTPDEFLKYVALYHSKKLVKDVDDTIKTFKK